MKVFALPYSSSVDVVYCTERSRKDPGGDGDGDVGSLLRLPKTIGGVQFRRG